jgi:H+/Cl- antiporter ClcA
MDETLDLVVAGRGATLAATYVLPIAAQTWL